MRALFRAARPFAATLGAFVAMTANTAVTAAVVTAGGIVVMLVLDYGRAGASYASGGEVVPFEARTQGPAGAREAA